jgi:alpha-amylase/alpha-mannosidase (GH57 family)
MSNKAICIHAHFYQPPREDPLTGSIPLEPGASPYSNWNERIFDHCYRPNADLGNFEKISFNVGPTLMQWMNEFDSRVTSKIVNQDRINLLKNGIGNGIAQAYNHTILPLAVKEDKYTQIIWGMSDFECRFHHKPTGLWMPETAVDTATLEVMADLGVEYTILAPWQADVEKVDHTKPYKVALPSGKEITVFFYDQDLSMRVSFDQQATSNADTFFSNLIQPKLNHDNKVPQLLVIASDGELYGHHQAFRDKFLERLLDGARDGSQIDITYPGLCLKEHPAKDYIKIKDYTSWSCHHGIERWRGECGCTANATWKNPLRRGLNKIGELLNQVYYDRIRKYFENPWLLRHGYCTVFCGHLSIENYLRNTISMSLDDKAIKEIHLLLASQYERQRIFTSCGWFFEDFDRIEPRNNVAYAAQAVWLTYLATGDDLSEDAASVLKPVKSWRSGLTADIVFRHHLDQAKRYEKALRLDRD